MLLAIIGENCSGKSTLAKAVQGAFGGEIVTGKDYVRLAKSEAEAEVLFRVKLQKAVTEGPLIYVISEPEQLAFLPVGTVRVLVKTELDIIKERFRKRMRGNLPIPVEQMLERKHGQFDQGTYDYVHDGAKGDPQELCSFLNLHFAR